MKKKQEVFFKPHHNTKLSRHVCSTIIIITSLLHQWRNRATVASHSQKFLPRGQMSIWILCDDRFLNNVLFFGLFIFKVSQNWFNFLVVPYQIIFSKLRTYLLYNQNLERFPTGGGFQEDIFKESVKGTVSGRNF